MTLNIPEKVEFDSHEYLRADNVMAASGKFIIVKEPRQHTTQYGDKTFVDVKGVEGEEVFTWVVNTTSLRKLAEDFGKEEKDWLNQPVELECVKSNIEGKLKDVIYVKGSLKKED